jgi:hypothetical protein
VSITRHTDFMVIVGDKNCGRGKGKQVVVDDENGGMPLGNANCKILVEVFNWCIARGRVVEEAGANSAPFIALVG